MAALLEARPFRPFKSSEEYLYAMKEDLAEWFQILYPELCITVDNFLDRLETGVALCKHANAVKKYAAEYIIKRQARKIMTRSVTGALAQPLAELADVRYFSSARPGTFFARDNVSNFILWCRSSLKIFECLLFETDDLIMRKNEKHVILCLLEVARKGAKFGMLAPMLVQMERQIDREIAADQRRQDGYGIGQDNGQNADDDSDSELEDEQPVLMYGPTPQIVTNDLKSLDEMVRDLVEKCTCPTQFPMIRVSEGKYRIGDTKVLIFVRILRNHVMVRVGGGWDTLSHYLDKHDPCRCRAQHRTTQSARLVNRPGAADLAGARVYYDRSPPRTPQNVPTPNGNSIQLQQQKDYLGPPMNSLNRSRSRSPSYSRRSVSPHVSRKTPQPQTLAPPRNRSRSPTPNYVSTTHAKLRAPSAPKTPQTPSSRGASCSPTRSPSSLSPVHSAKFANGKSASNHVATIQIPADVGKLTLISEASLTIGDNGAATDHSDNASEVSDEGYRSLGLIQDKGRNNRSSLHSQNSIEDAEENAHHDSLTDQEITPPEEVYNETGLRKTNFSQIYADGVGPDSKPYKITKSASMDKPPYRSRSNSLDKNQQQLLQQQAEHMMTPPERRSSTKLLLGTGGYSQMKKSSSKPNVSTWSGRPTKQRASISTDTYMPFARNATGRSSARATYDQNGRRLMQSANSSPTKTPLKQQIVQTLETAHDDDQMLEKIKQLLDQYGSLNSLHGMDDQKPEGTQQLPPPPPPAFSTPRKDSKPDNLLSRIPAPVSHKSSVLNSC